MLIYFHLFLLIILLLLCMLLHRFSCCLFVISRDNFAKLFLVINSSILLLQSSLCSITMVLPLSALVMMSLFWLIFCFMFFIVLHS
jgi:hypothetical protein